MLQKRQICSPQDDDPMSCPLQTCAVLHEAEPMSGHDSPDMEFTSRRFYSHEQRRHGTVGLGQSTSIATDIISA